VHMGVDIGEGAVIGAGSVVTRSMPAWTVCAGVPCHAIRTYAKR
jgi:putative colanic acid biosynthesis acetyltransferase WcaF